MTTFLLFAMALTLLLVVGIGVWDSIGDLRTAPEVVDESASRPTPPTLDLPRRVAPRPVAPALRAVVPLPPTLLARRSAGALAPDLGDEEDDEDDIATVMAFPVADLLDHDDGATVVVNAQDYLFEEGAILGDSL